MASESSSALLADSTVARANTDTRRVVGSVRFVVIVGVLDICAAAGAVIAAAVFGPDAGYYVVVAVVAAGIGTLVSIGVVWLFHFAQCSKTAAR